MKSLKIELNAPVTITFTILSFLLVLAGYATRGDSIGLLACQRTDLKDPMQYVRLFSYIFVHADMTHFVNNFTTIILTGPMLEEKYGSKRLVLMIFVTAVVSGLAHLLLSGAALVGASGIVFLFIILCSCTSVKSGKLPVTLVLVVIIYIGQEILNGVANSDNISQLTHIIGGLCGIFFGLLYAREPKASE